jgi:copper chaperone CopZ
MDTRTDMDARGSEAGAVLRIGGMTCASCVARVEKALRKVPGVSAAAVNLATEKATVHGRAATGALVAAVREAGYDAAEAPAPGLPPERDGKADTGAALPAWWPVAAAALLSFPLVAPMLAQLAGLDWMLPGSALLPRRLDRTARGQRQHGPAGGHRHQRRLRPVALSVAGRPASAGPGWAA